MNGIIGRKLGMTSIYDEKGNQVACTIIDTASNVVTQVKSEDSDGYVALQVGYGDKTMKRVSKAMEGHFEKSGASPKRKIVEFRDCTLDKKAGDSISVDEVFAEGDIVNAIGTTKGKGFQGVVKRWNFRGVGDATHGQHNRLRAPGSVGAASTPSKVIKGMKMGGRTGGKRIKTKNLKVVRIFAEKNLLLVKGAVPGHKGSFVIIEK